MSERTFRDNLYFNYDQSKWRANPEAIYGLHLESILEKMESIMGDSYHEFKFVIYEHKMAQPYPEFRITGRDVILIMLSDENSTVPPPEVSNLFFAVFKAYYPLEENIRNVVPFPIGYSNSASLTRFIPFNERKYDASYAGNFLANRLDFYRQFNWLRLFPPFSIQSQRIRNLIWLLLIKLKIFRPTMYRDTYGKSICYWSGGFAKGLSREEYADIISNTRIALCPMGFLSTECFRLLETMRLGCVIVSDELPPSRWYKDSPIIVRKNWLQIRDVVSKLKRDPQKLAELHEKTLAWWRNVCSDDAVASYLADEIKRLQHSTQR